jgi:hypothetical protein
LPSNLPDCATGGVRCTAQLEMIANALKALWAKMAADGVRDVIHVMYSADSGSGVTEAEARSASLRKACDGVPAPLRCHLMATDEFVMGSLRGDAIHPSNASYDGIAMGVIALMQKEGMRR